VSNRQPVPEQGPVGLAVDRGDAIGVRFHVGRFGHPFFTEQMRMAPPGFTYRQAQDEGQPVREPRRIALNSAYAGRARELAEHSAIRGLACTGHVRRKTLRSGADCQLIHSAQILLRSSGSPYVVDFECVEAFSLYQRVALHRPGGRKRLLDSLLDARCRCLLPWTEAARRGLQTALGPEAASKLAAKTVTVLPAIEPRVEMPAARSGSQLRVLFVGTAFVAKGGIEALRAVKRVRATHDVRLDVVSNVPDRFWPETQDEGIVVHDWPVATERLERLFREAHLLLFPSHIDTLGFAMLEAMAHGMPVLAARHFSVDEVIEDSVSGLVVEGENPLYGDDGMSCFDFTIPLPRAFKRALERPSDGYVTRVADALARVAEDHGLHERLAGGALARVRDGVLSPGRRRRQLEEVYRAACDRQLDDRVARR
jgi:glycosyltransferase involved in cell wall biosynthesis